MKVETNFLRVTDGVDLERLRELCADPYIAKVGHDHLPLAPISSPRVQYLSAWVGERFAGAFMAFRASAIDWELHALLQRWALPWSRELGRLCLAWAFSHPIDRVTAFVIEGRARNYCLRLGFRAEGVRRRACVQKGVPRDVQIMGMLRSEFAWAS